MKFWIKILVAFCVVLVTGFAVWAFFFREKDELVAYNELSELLEYKESMALSTKLEKLEKFNYITIDETTKVFSDETTTGKEIIKVRNKCLSPDTIKVYDQDESFLFEYNSYYTIDEYADSFMQYMLPYLNNMEGSGGTLKKLKSSKKAYVKSLKEACESIDKVVEYQSTMEDTTFCYDSLLGKYNALSIKLKNLLYNASEVINYSISYFESAKSGDVLLNTYMSLNDSFARTLKTMTGLGLESNIDLEELDYANDLYYITSKINKVNEKQNIFTGDITELNYLNAYNALLNDNADILNTVFGKKFINKKQMADNQNLTDIPVNLHYNVVVILNVLGY